MARDGLRTQLAEELDGPLRVVARRLAHGIGAGAHRAARKGSGIEFAGHRPYTPGDDLRHLDRHALLRHARLLVREFHTDTERAVHLLVDASASMAYGLVKERGIPSKGRRAVLLAAGLAYAAALSGDALGGTLVTDRSESTWPPRAGKEALEKTLSELEAQWDQLSTLTLSEQKRGADPGRVHEERWERTLDHLGTRLPRGSILYVFSDFLDWNATLTRALSSLSTRGRTVRAVQVLSPDEVHFPFEGALRLLDPETGREVETDASSVRQEYQRRLDALTSSLQREVTARGGLWLRHLTDEAVDSALRPLALGVAR